MCVVSVDMFTRTEKMFVLVCPPAVEVATLVTLQSAVRAFASTSSVTKMM